MFESRFKPFGPVGFPGLDSTPARPGLGADLARGARILADVAATRPGGLHTSEIFDMACNIGNEHPATVHIAAKQFFVNYRRFVRAAQQCQRNGASRRRNTYEGFQEVATAFDRMDDWDDEFFPRGGTSNGANDADGSRDGAGGSIFEWALEQFLALMRARRKTSITPEGLCFLAGQGFPGMRTLLLDPRKLQDWFSAQVEVELKSMVKEIGQVDAWEREVERRFGFAQSPVPSPVGGPARTDIASASNHDAENAKRRHALEAALHQERLRERIREADMRKKEEDTRQAIILDRERDEDIELAVKRQEERQ